MLWNIIRDWFVSNIFGGYLSTGTIVNGGILGRVLYVGEDGRYTINVLQSNQFVLPIEAYNINNNLSINGIALGDWLSTTATIIVLCAMCFFLFLVVRWLFRLTSGLLSGRG